MLDIRRDGHASELRDEPGAVVETDILHLPLQQFQIRVPRVALRFASPILAILS